MDNDNNAKMPDDNFEPPAAGSEIKPSSEHVGESPGKAFDSVIPTQAPSQDTEMASVSSDSAGASMDQPAVSNNEQHPANTSSSTSGVGMKNWVTKNIIAVVIAGVLLIGGSAAAYVGVVVPNRPENIWARALNNTAKGYDSLLEKQGETITDLNTAKIIGDYRVESSGVVIEGNFQSESDQKVSKSAIDMKIMNSTINAEILTEISEENQYPDIYAKIDGLAAFQSLAAGTNLEGLITQVDGKWFVLEGSLLGQMLQAAEREQDAGSPEIKTEDITELFKAIGTVNRTYVFTTDKSKSIFNEVNFIDKEQRNNRATHHYQVTPNKVNLKSYAAELTKIISESNVYKTYYPDSGSIDVTGVNEAIDNLSGNEIIDVWVDSTTKLLQAVRFKNQETQDQYVEIGLNYTGSVEYPFYLELKDGEKESMKLQITLYSDKEGAEVSLEADSEVTKFDLNGTVTFTNDPIIIEKPAEAIPISTLIEQLFGGFMPVSLQENSISPSAFTGLDEFPLEADF